MLVSTLVSIGEIFKHIFGFVEHIIVRHGDNIMEDDDVRQNVCSPISSILPLRFNSALVLVGHWGGIDIPACGGTAAGKLIVNKINARPKFRKNMRHAKYSDVEWQCDIYVACWYFVEHQSYNFRMKALHFFLILISLIFTGCMAKWQGFGTLEAGMTQKQVQKAYGEPFQKVLLKRTEGGFSEVLVF